MDSHSFALKGFSEELRYPLMSNRNPLLSPPSSSVEVSPPSEPSSPLFNYVSRMENPTSSSSSLQMQPSSSSSGSLHMMYAPVSSGVVYATEMYHQGYACDDAEAFSTPTMPGHHHHLHQQQQYNPSSSSGGYMPPLRSHLPTSSSTSSSSTSSSSFSSSSFSSSAPHSSYQFPMYEPDLNQAVANLDESYEAFSNAYDMSQMNVMNLNLNMSMNMNMSQPVFWGASPSFTQKYPHLHEKEAPAPYYPFSSLSSTSPAPARSFQPPQQQQLAEQRRQWSPLSPPLEGKDDRKQSSVMGSASNPNTAPSSCIPSPHMSPNLQGPPAAAGRRQSSTSSGSEEHEEHDEDEDEDVEEENEAGVNRRRGSTGDILSVNDLIKDKNATDFPCMFTDCPKTFKRFEHLKRHLLVHTGEKNYGCSICDKSFSRSDNLVQHTRTHSKQKNLKKLSAEKLLILEQQLQKFEEQGRGLERKTKKNNERKISGPAAMGAGSSFPTSSSSTNPTHGSPKSKAKQAAPKDSFEYSFSAKV